MIADQIGCQRRFCEQGLCFNLDSTCLKNQSLKINSESVKALVASYNIYQNCGPLFKCVLTPHGRVHAYWTGNSVVSSLSIKSAISEDTGNYSCILPNTGDKVTASLHILKGIA